MLITTFSGFDEHGNEVPVDELYNQDQPPSQQQPDDEAEQDIRKELSALRKSRLYQERTKPGHHVKHMEQNKADDRMKHTEL
jgi:hypothetical protein